MEGSEGGVMRATAAVSVLCVISEKTPNIVTGRVSPGQSQSP